LAVVRDLFNCLNNGGETFD